MENKSNISELLSKPLWQMTGEEYAGFSSPPSSPGLGEGLSSTLTPPAGSHWIDLQKFYNMKKKEKEIVPKRTLHLDARVTQEEYDAVKKLADECGITVSKYTRECTLGHQPKYHLTDREIEALTSLTDARGDVVRLFSQVNSKEPEKRKLYFKNEKFRKAWLDSVNKILAYWDSIIDKMKE